MGEGITRNWTDALTANTEGAASGGDAPPAFEAEDIVARVDQAVLGEKPAEAVTTTMVINVPPTPSVEAPPVSSEAAPSMMLASHRESSLALAITSTDSGTLAAIEVKDCLSTILIEPIDLFVLTHQVLSQGWLDQASIIREKVALLARSGSSLPQPLIADDRATEMTGECGALFCPCV
jgi:sulfur transfer complex TusBCD TusB component (DsrH family)